MKLWKVMELLEENPTDVYEAELTLIGWTVRMSVIDEYGGYYHFEVFNGKRLVDQSLGDGAFNNNVALNLDWQLVQQPVPWQEAIQAWADGKKVSYSYIDDDMRFPFEGRKAMMTIEKVKNAEWYVED